MYKTVRLSARFIILFLDVLVASCGAQYLVLTVVMSLV